MGMNAAKGIGRAETVALHMSIALDIDNGPLRCTGAGSPAGHWGWD